MEGMWRERQRKRVSKTPSGSHISTGLDVGLVHTVSERNYIYSSWPFKVLECLQLDGVKRKYLVLIFLQVLRGSGSDWWLFQVSWKICRSHSIVVDKSSVGEGACEVRLNHQALVMYCWDTWRWKGRAG